MEASFCLRELVEKRFHSFQSQRNSSPILTPLERFLSISSNITKPPCQASDGAGGHVSGFSADGALSLFNTIGALPSGILLNNSSTYEGIVCFGGQSMAALTEDKMHANISFSSSSSRSSNSNSATAPPLNNIIKGQWTAEEDRMLLKLVKQHGVRKWSQIAKNLVGRIGKQCRERWHNHLRPDIKKEIWTEEEEKLLVEAHQKYGNRWAEIARHIPGRSENSIKNHWNATKRSQNAKRKSKKKAGQGARTRSSILENYIQTRMTKTPSTSSTQCNITYDCVAHEETSQIHASTALPLAELSRCMPSAQSILNFSAGMQHANTEKLVGFSGLETEDYDLLLGEDPCMLLVTPEALFTEETNDCYHVSVSDDYYFCSSNVDAQPMSSEVPDSSTVIDTDTDRLSGRGDMDLMEMVTWQMAQTSQSQQSTSSSNGSTV